MSEDFLSKTILIRKEEQRDEEHQEEKQGEKMTLSNIHVV